MPNFNFDLTLYGGDIGFLPGLEAWITTVIKDSVLRYAFPSRCLDAASQSAPLVPAGQLGVLLQPGASSATLWISAQFRRNSPPVTWCQCLCMMALSCDFRVLRHVGLLSLVSKFGVTVTL